MPADGVAAAPSGAAPSPSADQVARLADKYFLKTKEAVGRFGTEHIAVEHRLGALSLGEASVAIAVAHPRRAGAYDASRWVIEELKRRVPIWKLEHYLDGTREWVDPTVARAEAAR